jgi:hypothetical protein
VLDCANGHQKEIQKEIDEEEGRQQERGTSESNQASEEGEEEKGRREESSFDCDIAAGVTKETGAEGDCARERRSTRASE